MTEALRKDTVEDTVQALFLSGPIVNWPFCPMARFRYGKMAHTIHLTLM